MDVNPGMEGILEALCTLKKPYSHVLAGSRYLTPRLGSGITRGARITPR
jgi:hypothetical protein